MRFPLYALLTIALLASPAMSSAKDTAPATATVSIPDAPRDKAQIVFFRDSNYFGSLAHFKVREGNTVLGTLSNDRFFIATAEPGKHVYATHSQKKPLALQVEAGKTYYVRASVVFVGVDDMVTLIQSDATAFQSKAPKPAK